MKEHQFKGRKTSFLDELLELLENQESDARVEVSYVST